MVARSIKARTAPLLLYEKQSEFRNSRQWLRGFVAGRGAGKSRIGALDVVLRARAGESWMSVSPSNTVISDTTWPTFREVCDQLGIWLRGRKQPSHQAWFRTTDGGVAEITFRSGDQPEMLRGPSKAGLWLDEASVMHPDVLTIGMPVLRWRGKMGPLIMTFTPKGKRHWTFGAFYDRVDESGGVQFTATKDGTVRALVEDPDTGKTSLREVTDFGGVPFLNKPNSQLVHAHTLENPFLPPEFFEQIRGHYPKALAAQELGGEFIEMQGIMFLREWFARHMVDDAPRDALRVRYWDRASTAGGGSYSAGVLMAMTTDGRYFVEDVVRGQWSAFTRNRIMEETARADAAEHGNEVLIYVEQEGGSGGKEISQQTVQMLAGHPVFADVVSGKRQKVKDKLILPGEAKIVRALPLAAQCEAGNVYVVRGSWTDDYLEELAAFPEYAFSDQVDASSGAFNRLAAMKTMSAVPTTTSVEAMGSNRFGVQLIRTRQQRFRGVTR